MRERKDLLLQRDRAALELERHKREVQTAKRDSKFQSVDPQKVLSMDNAYFDILLSSSQRSRSKPTIDDAMYYNSTLPTNDEEDADSASLHKTRRKKKKMAATK